MELLLLAAALVVALLVGYWTGRDSRSEYITILEKFTSNFAEDSQQQKKEIRELTNTILLMRRKGNIAPPLDEEWGVYAMPETLENDDA